VTSLRLSEVKERKRARIRGGFEFAMTPEMKRENGAPPVEPRLYSGVGVAALLLKWKWGG
jgi:hypothetical protein